MEISEVLVMFFVTSFIGLFIASLKMCYKSKCTTIDLCCLHVVRDTKTEEQELEFTATHKTESKDSIEESKI